MRELKNRVAVVTGAAGGIGRALALEFARAGMDVALADLDIRGLSETARGVEGLGRRSACIEADVRHVAAVEHLLAETLSQLGSCHVIANNAGVFHGAPLLDTPPEQWLRVLDTNLWGVIHGCRVFGAHFVKQGQGHIVNTASAAGLFPVAGMSAYSTTKFAVVALSLQLRWELASAGVGVSVLCPGVVKTGITQAPGVGLEHLDLKALLAQSPLPAGLARKTVRAVQRDQALIRYGFDSYVLSLLRLLPLWLIDPLGKRLAYKTVRILRGEEPLRLG